MEIDVVLSDITMTEMDGMILLGNASKYSKDHANAMEFKKCI
jgi:YesN/AraC family two-component response regulator